MLLNELSQSVSRLKGVGPKSASLLSALGIQTLSDLLQHFPRTYEDHSRVAPLGIIPPIDGGPPVWVNTRCRITGTDYFGSGFKKTLKVEIEDETGSGSLVCFGRNFLADKLTVGREIFISGSFSHRFGENQASAFEWESVENPKHWGKILPIYPAAEGLTQGFLRKIMKEALSTYAPPLEDPWPGLDDGELGRLLMSVHFPQDQESLKKAREALKRRELFLLLFQISLSSNRNRRSRANAAPQIPGDLSQKALSSLDFDLTDDQKTVQAEIRADLQSNEPMTRLLQGDVGSGKTLCAFLAALDVIETGRQAAFMAPTELLARQHAQKAAEILEPLGVRLAFLSGKTKNRAPLLQALKEGKIDLIIGTHALFGRELEFNKLALVIIDEQHKFGVNQRSALTAKGENPDLLLLSATPIPRTLAMTLFGDRNVSTIKTMPKGRIPVKTHLARIGNENRVYDFVRRELDAGRRAYFVYPRIESGDGKKSASEMADYLASEVFPDRRVGLIHSKVDQEAKEAVMTAFSSGELDLLVATTVVEVGVDVKEATCIVIEEADSFGLSQLHQMRGRVGRGDLASYAFLVYSEPLTEEAKHRLLTLKETSDGFRVAEEDLKLRGPGELIGKKQAGVFRLKIADIIEDFHLAQEERTRGAEILTSDPELVDMKNRKLKLFAESALEREEQKSLTL